MAAGWQWLGKTVAFGGLALAVVTPSGAQVRTEQTKEAHMSDGPELEYATGARSRPLPFSDVVRVGDLLFLSGQLGVDDQMALVPGGIQAETRQIMERIRRLLEQHGSSMSRVVKCTCMLADMSEWPAMNEVYVGYFPRDRLPARSAFAARALALDARVEIECIAAVK
jgi:2-iminobutanoate/2-iminopropanoate deaminase